MVKRCSLW